MNKLSRKCPKCSKILTYSWKQNLNYANKINSKCNKCKIGISHMIGTARWKKWKLSLSKSLKNRKFTKKWKDKLREANLGHTDSIETRKKKSIAMSGIKNPFYGKSHSEKTKTILRKKFHDRMVKKYGILGCCPMYNPDACKIIDEYGSKHNYNFQHALNGGEYYINDLGYWVDGYDKSKNVVIEYYENNHRRKLQKVKDIIRIKKIKNSLKCKIIILKEWNSIPEII